MAYNSFLFFHSDNEFVRNVSLFFVSFPHHVTEQVTFTSNMCIFDDYKTYIKEYVFFQLHGFEHMSSATKLLQPLTLEKIVMGWLRIHRQPFLCLILLEDRVSCSWALKKNKKKENHNLTTISACQYWLSLDLEHKQFIGLVKTNEFLTDFMGKCCKCCPCSQKCLFLQHKPKRYKHERVFCK